jgi:hypothetical protein
LNNGGVTGIFCSSINSIAAIFMESFLLVEIYLREI